MMGQPRSVSERPSFKLTHHLIRSMRAATADPDIFNRHSRHVTQRRILVHHHFRSPKQGRRVICFPILDTIEQSPSPSQEGDESLLLKASWRVPKPHCDRCCCVCVSQPPSASMDKHKGLVEGGGGARQSKRILHSPIDDHIDRLRFARCFCEAGQDRTAYNKTSRHHAGWDFA